MMFFVSFVWSEPKVVGSENYLTLLDKLGHELLLSSLRQELGWNKGLW